jgi:hypothetical protein
MVCSGRDGVSHVGGLVRRTRERRRLAVGRCVVGRRQGHQGMPVDDFA